MKQEKMYLFGDWRIESNECEEFTLLRFYFLSYDQVFIW